MGSGPMMTGRRFGVCFILPVMTAICSCPAVLGAAQVVLVKNRIPVSCIVLGQNPSDCEKRAAEELQNYMEKMSGARIPVRENDTRIPGSRILVGTFESNPAIKAMQRRLKVKGNPGEEGFLLITLGQDLIITGQEGSGVLHGTYTFLEKYLGCRWYFPGEEGEVVPRRDSISVPEIEDVQKPSLHFRCMHMSGEGTIHQYSRAIADWMARNKMNGKKTHHHVLHLSSEDLKQRAITPDTNCHSFWWLVPAKQYYDTHPGYFPLIGGKRVRPEGEGSIDCQLCLSNPEVVRICVEKTEGFIKQFPEVKVLGFTPNDNHTGVGFCECDNCKALGKTQTDRLVAFVNNVAGDLHKRHPDKHVGFLAYSDCTEPASVKPLDCVTAEYVRNGRCCKHALNDPTCKMNQVRALEIAGWLRTMKASNLNWGDYTDLPDDLPQPTARVVAEDMKWLHKMGMGGFMSACTPSSWPMQKLNHYVAAKVSWDATLRYEDLLDDFCRNYYGPAGKLIKKYYQALDKACATSEGCFPRGRIPLVEAMLSQDLARELKTCLMEAQRLAAGRADLTARVEAERSCFGRSVKAALGTTDPDKPPAPNLITNPGFEEGQQGWTATVQRGKYELKLDEDQAHKEKHSAKIVCTEPGRAMWHCTIPVEKGKAYYFSVWAKAQDKPPGTTILWLHQGPTHLTGKLAYLEDEAEGEWRKYVIPEITTIEDTLTVFLMSDGPGTIWFDEVALRRIGE